MYSAAGRCPFTEHLESNIYRCQCGKERWGYLSTEHQPWWAAGSHNVQLSLKISNQKILVTNADFIPFLITYTVILSFSIQEVPDIPMAIWSWHVDAKY